MTESNFHASDFCAYTTGQKPSFAFNGSDTFVSYTEGCEILKSRGHGDNMTLKSDFYGQSVCSEYNKFV